MVGSRESGEIVVYPAVEMEFNKKSNQVEYVISPAQVDRNIKSAAEDLAYKVSEKFNHITNFSSRDVFDK